MQSNYSPHGCTGADSLTFDDGQASQLERAIPLMNTHGLCGTFYLCPRGDDYQEKLAPWAAAHARGHEMGNHTLSHTCSRNFNNTPGAAGLETMSLEDVEADILGAERRLRELFPRQSRSFCYPCYMTHVGEGLRRQSYVPVVAKHFVAARASGEYGFCNHAINSDLACLAAQPCERMTGPEMVGLAERAARQGRWLILAFHGLECGRLGTALCEFQELVEHLAAHRERIWTAPVAQVAEHLLGVRAA